MRGEANDQGAGMSTRLMATGSTLFILCATGCGDKEEAARPAPADDTASGGGSDDTASGGSADDTATGSDDTGGGGGGGCVAVQGSSGASGPEIGITPSTHDFGKVDLGCADTLAVVVENRGGAALSLSGLDFSTGSADLTLDSSAVSPPQSLDPGDAVCLELTYHPVDTYSDVAYLQVQSNDPSQPEVLVSVAGEGNSVGTGSDSHTASGGLSFPLSSKPLPDHITVEIDGVRTSIGWTYDAGTNAVVFDSSYVPEAGAVVELSYELSAC